MSLQKIAIVGAGISGLSAAYTLKKQKCEIDVFEKNAKPGGAIKTETQNGWLTEYGPNSLLIRDATVRDFLAEIGLLNSIVEANRKAAKRFIVKKHQLHPLPSSLMSAVKTPLFSFNGKARVLLEPFIKKNETKEETVADFVSRRLGTEILDYGINPFVAGIFANNPNNLSLKHAFPAMHHLEQEYGSLIWGAISGKKERVESGRIDRKLVSFEGGLQELPEKIASMLPNVYYNTRVQCVYQKNDGWYIQSGNTQYGPYNKVIVNIPLYQWSNDFLDIEGFEEQLKEDVTYPPLSVLHLGYKKTDIKHALDGFGFLVPEKEKLHILGALFSSTLFKNRAPEGHHLLTVFIGGGRDPELAHQSTEKLIKLAQADLHKLIGLRGRYVFKEHVFWPKSIPGYHVGYGDVLDKISDMEEKNPGLYIAGNFRHGISVPDCIKTGLSLAQKISKKL